MSPGWREVGLVTILGERLAEEGVTFEYQGYLDACDPCPLNEVCHRLKVGRHYRVTEVRPKRHDCCTVFEGDVAVVEVEEVARPMNVPVAAARGTSSTHTWEPCGVPCPWKKHCDPLGLPRGAEVELVEVGEDPVECKVGRDLRLADVRVLAG